MLFGLLITVIFGAAALNKLATNGIQFCFIPLLVLFAASFLGGFELTRRTAGSTGGNQNRKKGLAYPDDGSRTVIS